MGKNMGRAESLPVFHKKRDNPHIPEKAGEASRGVNKD